MHRVGPWAHGLCLRLAFVCASQNANFFVVRSLHDTNQPGVTRLGEARAVGWESTQVSQGGIFLRRAGYD